MRTRSRADRQLVGRPLANDSQRTAYVLEPFTAATGIQIPRRRLGRRSRQDPGHGRHRPLSVPRPRCREQRRRPRLRRGDPASPWCAPATTSRTDSSKDMLCRWAGPEQVGDRIAEQEAEDRHVDADEHRAPQDVDVDPAMLPDLDDVLVHVEVAIDRLQQIERGMRGRRLLENRPEFPLTPTGVERLEALLSISDRQAARRAPPSSPRTPTMAGVSGALTIDSQIRMAEREGFEPSMGYQPILP